VAHVVVYMELVDALGVDRAKAENWLVRCNVPGDLIRRGRGKAALIEAQSAVVVAWFLVVASVQGPSAALNLLGSIFDSVSRGERKVDAPPVPKGVRLFYDFSEITAIAQSLVREDTVSKAA